MIITCEECNTNYTIPDGSITGVGRMVKCVKCSNIWHQSPIAKKVQFSKNRGNVVYKPNGQPKNPPPAVKEAENLPSVIDVEANFLFYALYSLTGVFFFISFVIFMIFSKSFMMNNFPSTAGIYNIFNGYTMKGVMFRDITLTKIPNKAGFNLFVKGKIINNSTSMRNMPDLRISILDENKHIMASQNVYYAQKFIDPKSILNVNNMVTNLPNEAKFIALDLGSPMDLALR